MSTSHSICSACSRLNIDYLDLQSDPVPYIQAEPLPNNILEWHFVFCGPENTSYEGGYYHGKLIFPQEFPFVSPSIYMITPNGRFKSNRNLCLNINQGGEWHPLWSVSTILTGLLSLMLEETPTLGSIICTSDRYKRQLAFDSLEFNLKNRKFCELFPDTVTAIQETLRQRRTANIDVAGNQSVRSLTDRVPRTANIDIAGNQSVRSSTDRVSRTANIVKAGNQSVRSSTDRVLRTAKIDIAGNQSVRSSTDRVSRTANIDKAGNQSVRSSTDRVSRTANIDVAGNQTVRSSTDRVLRTENIDLAANQTVRSSMHRILYNIKNFLSHQPRILLIAVGAALLLGSDM